MELDPRRGASPAFARYRARIREFWAVLLTPQPGQKPFPDDPVHIGGVPAPQPNEAADADSLGFMYLVQGVGLPILAGSDAICRGVTGFSLHAELAAFVAEGLTPWPPCRAPPFNPAKFLRGTDSLGTIAPGKLADLVLLDADPLADIANTTRNPCRGRQRPLFRPRGYSISC